jgi:hypothetical protein
MPTRGAPRRLWQRLLARVSGGTARQRSRTRLADELFATFDPLTLFTAGYPAHRRVRAYRRHARILRIRSSR